MKWKMILISVFICLTLGLFGCSLSENIGLSIYNEAIAADDREKEIIDSLEELPEVMEATASIIGNTAIIGIKIYPDYYDNIGNIKLKARHCVLCLDKDVNSVSVTADEKLFERIKRL